MKAGAEGWSSRLPEASAGSRSFQDFASWSRLKDVECIRLEHELMPSLGQPEALAAQRHVPNCRSRGPMMLPVGGVPRLYLRAISCWRVCTNHTLFLGAGKSRIAVAPRQRATSSAPASTMGHVAAQELQAAQRSMSLMFQRMHSTSSTDNCKSWNERERRRLRASRELQPSAPASIGARFAF